MPPKPPGGGLGKLDAEYRIPRKILKSPSGGFRGLFSQIIETNENNYDTSD